jgi:hypothetical protein
MRVYTYDWLERNGRLGNQLWQIAATIGLANREPNAVARFRPDWEYRKFFSVPDEYFYPAPDGPVEFVDGETNYFQEVEYLEGVDTRIKEYFQPSDLSVDYLRENYQEFFSISKRCAIHVRRGDYLKYPKHFSKMTNKYYKAAMESMPEGTNFVIFSDDQTWCRKNFGPGHFYVDGVARPVEVADRKGEPQDQYDMFLMTTCDNHIISNSTFSWWGAYLSNNPSPIYPSKWYESSLAYIPWQKMFPLGWRKYEC